MFFPGETITHIFHIPFALKEINHVVLSYKQNGAIILEKTITSGFESQSDQITKITHVLSQTESLLFEDVSDFTIQCNVYTNSGTRHASHEMKGSSGIQYLRDVLQAVPISILIQPSDFTVTNIGDIATFTVSAQSVMRYQWQYRVNEGEWKDTSAGTGQTLEVVSTQERINTHQYRCVLYSFTGDQVTTNAVRIKYTDRSDE